MVRDDARKSILKRDTHSFDEVRQSPYLCPLSLDRKAKSFEEREEDYDRARSRIFSRTGGNHDGYSGGGEEEGRAMQGRTSTKLRYLRHCVKKFEYILCIIA